MIGRRAGGGEFVGVFVEVESFFRDARGRGVVPRRPDVGFAVDGESLDAGGLGGFVAGGPLAVGGVDLLVDAFHVIIDDAADDGVATVFEAGAIVVTIPDDSCDGSAIGGNPGVFGFGGGGGGAGAGF